jgi:hypothetical protein
MNEVDLDQLKAEIGSVKHIAFVNCRGPLSSEELHLEVCNRKVPIHARFKFATEVFQRIYDQYGHRALQAEKNEGVDWKALMHAIRVTEEAKELLRTGNVTFPRPEREFLVRIRKGEVPYQEVAESIEMGIEEIEFLQQSSLLAESIDLDYWESWITKAYGEYVSKHFK